MPRATSSIRPIPASAVMSLFLALAGSTLTGCYAEGGPWSSQDSYAYVSREWEPKTITLRDTRTGQDFWSIDIPVGKKLLMSFDDEGGSKNGYTPSLMTWGLVDESYELGCPDLKNTLAVPPASGRRLDVAIRPTPEFPTSMVAATKGAVSPVRPATVREPTVSVPTRPSTSVDLPPGGMTPPPVRPANPETTPPSQPGMGVQPAAPPAPPAPPIPPAPAAPAPTPAPKGEPPINLPG